MKRIEDLEKMSLQELEMIADDKSINVPKSMNGRIEAAILGESLKEEHRKSSRSVRYGIGGAAVAAAAGLVLALDITQQPKDTFDDPAMAYAELEKTFAYISDKMNMGLDIATDAAPAFDKASEILNKINN